MVLFFRLGLAGLLLLLTVLPASAETLYNQPPFSEKELERIFCIMGRAAAAVAIIQQGDAITKEPPIEMPNVSDDELDVVRRNLPGLLKAISPAPTPKK